jgi:hypothetical protein
MATIDLQKITGPGEVHVLSGRELGAKARDMFKLDALDGTNAVVQVIVPSYVFSLTPSFFEGLFGQSVRAHGSDPQRFRDHFRFVAPPIVLDQVEHGLSEVLASGGSNALP